ncbi:MAG: hypothetical protein PHI52_03770 [Bacteroidales bacterium]|nr:hypothetical protein [Bacteroidales bacterium]
MSLYYNVTQRVNLQDPQGPKLWYPVLKSIGILREKDVAMLMADETTMNPKEAEMALYRFQKVLLREIAEGKIIEFSELGSFRLTLSATGMVLCEEVSSACVQKINLRFQASQNVNDLLQQTKLISMDKLMF